VAYGTLSPPHGQKVSALGDWKGCSPMVSYAVVPTRVWSPFLCPGVWFVWQAICRLDRPRPVAVAVSSNRPHVRPTFVHLLVRARLSSRRVSCTLVMEVETAGSSFRLHPRCESGLPLYKRPLAWVRGLGPVGPPAPGQSPGLVTRTGNYRAAIVDLCRRPDRPCGVGYRCLRC
jgi:hypothetical protein